MNVIVTQNNRDDGCQEHVIHLTGNFDCRIPAETYQLVAPLLQQPDTRLITLDLAALTGIDCFGLGVMRYWQQQARRAECDLWIRTPRTELPSLLKVANCSDLLAPAEIAEVI